MYCYSSRVIPNSAVYRRCARRYVAGATAALALAAMGCAGKGQSNESPTIEPSKSPGTAYLRAEKRVRRHLIDYLADAPSGHGYQRGDFVAFYRPLETQGADPGARLAVGYGQVQSAQAHTLILAWHHLPADQRAQVLDVRELPDRASFQQYVGQILAHEVTGERAGWLRINIGDSDGVRVRDQYQVLGQAIGDANLDARSLGREVIGQLEVMEAPDGKSFALARLVAGRAPAGSWLEWSGRNPNPVGDDVHVRILVARFVGDTGGVYSGLLSQRLDEIARTSNGAIVIEKWPHVIATSDADRIREIGRQKGAHLVVWGEGRDDRALAERGQARGWITPKLTFVYPTVSGEEQRMWAELKMPLSSVADSTGDKDQHISALAYRLVGMAHIRRGDYTQALVVLNRVLAADQVEAVDRMATRILLFHAYKRTGSWHRAEKLARQIIADGQAAGNALREADGLYNLGDISVGLGRLDEALDLLDRARRMYEREGDERSGAITWGRIADVYYQRGQLDEILAICEERQLPVFQKLRDIGAEAGTWMRIADIYFRRGQLDDALAIHKERVLPVFQKLGSSRDEANAWRKIANIHYRRGNLDEALTIRKERELAVYQKLHDIHAEADTWGKIADVYYQKGRLDESLTILKERQLPVYQKAHDIRSEAIVWGHIANIYLQRGRLGDALAIRKERQLPVFKKLRDIHSEAVTWGKIADIHYRRGKLNDALEIRKERELPVYQKLRDVHAQVITWGKIANVYARQGRLDEAIQIYEREVIAVCVESKLSRDLVMGSMNLAKHYWKRDNGSDRARARELLERAHTTASSLGLPQAGQIAATLRRIGTAAGP